ncbi:MAG: HAMP domain-containing sensor histidine kinase, partial [Pseudomonadota bacterium]
MANSPVDREKVRNLRRLLTLFFVILMMPIGALLYFAYEQMKWEVFHQFRQQAEVLANRIDAAVSELVSQENLRPSSDYQFLATRVTNGDIGVALSPLAERPAEQNIPGLVGHFHIGADGQFTTPLMPSSDSIPDKIALTADELSFRETIAARLQQILTSETESSAEPRRDIKKLEEQPTRTNQEDLADSLQVREEKSISGPLAGSANLRSGVASSEKTLSKFDAKAKKSYQQNRQRLGSVAELALDDRLAQRAIDENEIGIDISPSFDEATPAPVQRRKEQVASYATESYRLADKLAGDSTPLLKSRPASQSPSPPVEADYDPETEDRVDTFELKETIADDSSPANPVEIFSFEREIEPFQLAAFDDEHLILHRNVWQNGERAVQGAVLHRDTLINAFVGQAFDTSTLASMSQLVVAFNDDVLNIFSSPSKYRISSRQQDLSGTVLYQRALVSPFDGFSLLFNITRLPLGTSIKYLAWVTSIMMAVLLIGFFIIYRYGKRQIALFRQQQDFVSAVSHELKTPLTSIRMYSEMLKNEWAPEEKKAGYYEYIHSESERLSRLIENVLQLARINRKQTEIKIDTIDIRSLLDNVLSSISSLAEAKDFVITTEFEQTDTDKSIRASTDACLQIIINIVDNAIKFSRNAERKEVLIRSKI